MKFLFDFPWMMLVAVFICACAAPDRRIPDESYVVETIALPEGLEAETGGLAFLPDRRLAACFLRGEVMLYDPVSSQWSLFADGLHQPLGILVIDDSELLVMQRPELTRIKDIDHDGVADLYETVTDDFGITGNYHEWNYGPLKDRDGNLFISLNTASEYGLMMKEVRGRLDTTLVPGKPRQKFSAVPYRGWVMKIGKDKKLIPFASGFRSPNGLAFDLDGNLFVTENQGDWVGTSALYKVEENKFYGHPASLLWKEGWNQGDPSKLRISQLDSMRTRAAVLFPHTIMSASPTQPVVDDTDGKFGPFAGQLFVGEMNQERMMRVMLEEVDGEIQGACMPFIDGHGLRKGNNRAAFAPDGSLWVGQAQFGFIGDRGIQRIVFTGRPPVDLLAMKLTKDGFDLNFTEALQPTGATNPLSYRFRRYYYEYHLKYGSDQFDVQDVEVTGVQLSDDKRKVSLTLSSLKPGYIYELTLGDIRSDAGEGIANHLVCYTVNSVLPAKQTK